MIEYKDVGFSYGDQVVLKNLNVRFKESEYVLITGPNGAGKSTLIKTMLGLIEPTTGEITFDGIPLKRFKAWRRIGYVAQNATNLQVTMPISVYELVSLGVIHKATREMVLEKLRLVEMNAYIDENVHNLSGGQQQRVFIARALMSNPDMLVLDEPTVGLDVQAVQRFYDLIAKLHKQDTTIVMVTHDMHVLSAEATRVLAINKEIDFDGSVKAYRQWHETNCFYCGNMNEHNERVQGGNV